MRTLILSFLFLLPIVLVHGQDKNFVVRINKDTIYAGHKLSIEFEMNNINGVFTPPDFDGFKILSGPNTSSNFSMINGVVTQKSVYGYILRADVPGSYVIGPAYAKTENNTYETIEINIEVLPNPDGIPEYTGNRNKKLEFRSDSTNAEPQAKPKRKIKKI
ncbi:MAG: BatD family protein [Saprospiraceae bacterium]|nr:BatD family protein [Saprospiraceae bacterium]